MTKQPNKQPPGCPPATCKRVGYFRMSGPDGLRLSQAPGKLCTHIVLTSARIDSDGSLVLAREADRSFLDEVPVFKRQYPAIKVLISVSNERELDSDGFSRAALLADNRQNFARSTVDFLKRHSLDGVDLDWQYPNYPTNFVSSRESERTGFTKILKTLRSAIVENFFDRQVAEQHLNQPNKYHNITPSDHQPVEPYLLTVAVAGQEAILRASYELKQLANLCDWFHVKSYDYFIFKAYAPFTGPNSPLYPIVDPFVPILNKLSFAWTLNRLLEDEIPREKIVMGIPTYGRAYKLVFKNTQPTPFSLALGPRVGQSEEHLRYPEVCAILERPDSVVDFDAKARVPYLLADDGTTWISFENSLSVREKVRYVLDNNLLGYMTWNLNYDAFTLPNFQTNEAYVESDNRKKSVPSFPLHQAMSDEALQSKSDEPGKATT